ncbi:MFS transporter [Actinomadura roseirufa]|uniref:MFS transporter n=1 Tax=Actinomadura roseirufa TaxID=2094049 RepID=UPI0013F16D12|nr:MFS transporter [Actinomadura roseirufa]
MLNQLGAFALPFLAVLAGAGRAALVLAVFGGAALVSRRAGGVLLDRMAPRSVIVLGLTATGVALLALAAARGTAQITTATALAGLAFELYEPATQEALARHTDAARRDAVYGLLGTSLVAAGAAAGLLAAVLLPLGVRWLIVVDGATCLAAAGVAAAFTGRQPLRRRVRDDRWRPPGPLVRLTAAGTAFACGTLAVLLFAPLVLLERGAPPWLPGLVLTCAAVLAPVTGHLGRRVLRGAGTERVLAAGSAVLGALALVMAAGRAVPLTVAAYLAWAAADSVLQGRWPALIADLAPAEDRPRWFAFHGMSWGVAQPAVPALAALTGGALATGGAVFLAVPPLLAAGRLAQRLKITARTRSASTEHTTNKQ